MTRLFWCFPCRWKMVTPFSITALDWMILFNSWSDKAQQCFLLLVRKRILNSPTQTLAAAQAKANLTKALTMEKVPWNWRDSRAQRHSLTGLTRDLASIRWVIKKLRLLKTALWEGNCFPVVENFWKSFMPQLCGYFFFPPLFLKPSNKKQKNTNQPTKQLNATCCRSKYFIFHFILLAKTTIH